MRKEQVFSEREILEFVGTHYGVNMEEIRSNLCRKRHYVLIRQVAMYLMEKYTKKTLKEIGSLFAGKNHATVIYAKETVQDLAKTDKSFAKDLLMIEKKLLMIVDEEIDNVAHLEVMIEISKTMLGKIESDLEILAIKAKSVKNEIELLEIKKSTMRSFAKLLSGEAFLEVA